MLIEPSTVEPYSAAGVVYSRRFVTGVLNGIDDRNLLISCLLLSCGGIMPVGHVFISQSLPTRPSLRLEV